MDKMLLGLISTFFIYNGSVGVPISNTIQLVHVLFRHGNRTPDIQELYPKDPYKNFSYYPFEHGQLVNVGKQREYEIGERLRDRYNDFLGNYYTPSIIESHTTDYDRTKMSLELVLASLYPSKGEEIWNKKLNWQPIPFIYEKPSQDKILNGAECPNYKKLYADNYKTNEIQKELSLDEKTIEYISVHTGLNITKYYDLYELYFGLKTEEEFGFKLPKWTVPVWPEKMENLALKEYKMQTANYELKTITSGYLIKKLLESCEAKINGTIPKKKIYLYSAHESNIANLLASLDIFTPPHVPNYGAYIIFELHKINGHYGFYIYYENYTHKTIQLLKLPSCDTFCLLDDFYHIIEPWYPKTDVCGK